MISVADLPGIIEDSHKNKGLGIQFLRHAERCAALLLVLDMSLDSPWRHLDLIKRELEKFSPALLERPLMVVANKIDKDNAQDNLNRLQSHTDLDIIPISAKLGTNVASLLKQIRIIYDKMQLKESNLK